MLYFNSCPRCQTGTIEYTTDMWGKYLSCLMCGYAIHSKSIRPDNVGANAEPSMGTPSLVGAVVSTDDDSDDEDLGDDADFADDFDDSDEEDESPARVAFG